MKLSRKELIHLAAHAIRQRQSDSALGNRRPPQTIDEAITSLLTAPRLQHSDIDEIRAKLSGGE